MTSVTNIQGQNKNAFFMVKTIQIIKFIENSKSDDRSIPDHDDLLDIYPLLFTPLSALAVLSNKKPMGQCEMKKCM